MGTKLTAAAQALADKRAAMIAEAAYFTAERRNFRPGDELSDWLAAERQIELTLISATNTRQKSAPQDATIKPAKKKVAKVSAKKAPAKKAAARKASAKKPTAKKPPAKKAAAKRK
jgi:hypothetical protein